MNIRTLLLFLILHTVSWCGNSDELRTPAQIEYDRVASQISGLSVSKAPSAVVHNIIFSRDASLFTLEKGTLYLLPQINSRTHAMLFVGTGTVAVTPPTDVERKQLKRFYEEEIFPYSFRTLFLLFTDSTYEELTSRLTFADTPPAHDISAIVSPALRLITDTKSDEIDADILRAFLFNEQRGMFYSYFAKDNYDSYFFQIDPAEDEGVTFGRKVRNGLISRNGFRESILRFHPAKRNEGTINKDKQEVDITGYSMKNIIADDLDLSVACTMTFTTSASGRRWIPFTLYHRMTIDSILWDTGKKIDFIRYEESDLFWLYDSGGFLHDKTLTATVYAHGDIVVNTEGWFWLRTSTEWYPHPLTVRDWAKYDLTFTVPSKYRFASIGSCTSTSIDQEQTTTRWKLDSPGRNASFIIGQFKEYNVQPDSIPPITVLLSDAHDVQMRGELARSGVLSGKDMDKQVAGDIENSIRFFQHLYGPASVDKFTAAEIPEGHGEAFPGLLHLSWTTFQNTSTDGSDEVFRAHEVAHQWWGIGVDFASYHDQWLSEAFATYSGLWYMQTIIRDNEIFFEQLKKYRKAILTNRKYLLGDGQESGPIWLGYRTSSTATEGDYNLIIYRKGAWVLHMLRNMGLELKTMNEDLFRSMMKEFYQSYRGKKATTEDFKKITEKYFRVKMDWFFNQWVYNTEIPKYNILYTLMPQENGKFKVKCRVQQSNVPDDFQMYIPFSIDFGDNRYARIRYLIKGPVTEFEFPVLPLKPEEIKFNYLESVLCEIDDEEWD